MPIPESVAMVSAALLWAIIPAFVARPAVLKVCEFRPTVFATYFAFAVGFLAVIAWREAVLYVREPFMVEHTGTAILLGWSASIAGGLSLLIFSVSRFIRDAKQKPIGLGSAIIVTILALIWTFPIALVLWFVSAFYFLPTPGA